MKDANTEKPISVIGITGGIASGKTVATDALKSAGYTVIDADEVSRALTAKGTPIERELIRLFPAAEKDGTLDRRALRAIIATDKDERKRLDEYTHPLILSEVKKQLDSAAKPVVLSAPLLFETALSALCDITVCVVCPKRKRIKRLTARDGVNEKAAEEMIAAQIPDYFRATISDYCVSSDCIEEAFKNRVLELFSKILHGI